MKVRRTWRSCCIWHQCNLCSELPELFHSGKPLQFHKHAFGKENEERWFRAEWCVSALQHHEWFSVLLPVHVGRPRRKVFGKYQARCTFLQQRFYTLERSNYCFVLQPITWTKAVNIKSRCLATSNSTTMFNILNFMHCMCLNIDVGLCKIWRVANEKAIYVCINLH